MSTRTDITGNAQKMQIENSTWRTCLTCLHYEEAACAKAGGVIPPVEVVVIGCIEWEDRIPF